MIIYDLYIFCISFKEGGEDPIHCNGFLHLTPGNREKSVSVEINSQPCSLARAARCASVTRFATA